MAAIDVHCIHCGQKLSSQCLGLWFGESDIAPQYCWIDPMHGSQLHVPAIKLELSSEYANCV